MDIKQIAGLALFAVNLELEDINRHTIPGGFLNMDKISYWGIHEWKKKELIKEIFGVDIEIDPKNDIQYIKKERQKKKKHLWRLQPRVERLSEKRIGLLKTMRD